MTSICSLKWLLLFVSRSVHPPQDQEAISPINSYALFLPYLPLFPFSFIFFFPFSLFFSSVFPNGVFRIWQREGYGERVEREPTTGVWGRSPQRDPGAEPLVGGGSGERSPPEAETLFAFERSMKAANSLIFLKFGNAENHRYLQKHSLASCKTSPRVNVNY